MDTTTLRRARLALGASLLALPLLAAPLAAQTPLIVSKNAAGDTLTVTYDDGTFVAFGAQGTLDLPVTGVGQRLMWYPGKGAFRAGSVETNNGTGTEWDEANIGFLSVALGDATMASGGNSLAAGLATHATAAQSVALGQRSVASSDVAVAVGTNAMASGSNSMALGTDVTASGTFSTVIGSRASADGYTGAIVLGDAAPFTVGGDTMRATANNQLAVRASGGIRLRTSLDTLSGCDIDGAGNMTCTGTVSGTSDVNRKDDFAPVEADQVLQKLASLPIGAWSYKADPPGVRHVGPMAQAFHAAFGLGANDVTIATVDADGINMLAIQALERRTETLRKQVAAARSQSGSLRKQVEAARAENADLRRRVQRLEAVVQQLVAKEHAAAGHDR
ncbi:MAG: tail fiber domain-containing protein [Gemmatimonadota bacterium]